MGKHSKADETVNTMNEINEAEVRTEQQVPETAVEVPQSEEVVEQVVSEGNGEAEMKEEPIAEAEEEPSPKKAKKKNRKRRRGGIPLQVVVLLMFITLLFGVILGFILGRNSMNNRLNESETRVTELEGIVAESGSSGELDIFTEELTEENQEALQDLSGNIEAGTPVDEGALALQGEDGVDYGNDAVEAENDDAIAAEYAGGVITAAEARAAYDDDITGYIFEGEIEEEIDGEALMTEVLSRMVTDRVLAAKAQEMGIYELTSADDSKIDAVAKEAVDARNAQESDVAEDEEADPVSYDTVRAEIREGWWRTKLFDELTKDVVVDDAAIQSVYDELLERQQADFSNTPEDYEYVVMSGEPVVYIPEGYFNATLIVITDPEQAAEAKQKLKEKASFDMLARDYGSETVALCDGTIRVDEAVFSALRTLKNIGDTTEPIELEDGTLVIGRYDGLVNAGPIPIAQVRDRLKDLALETAKQKAYDTQVAAWLAEADPKYYPENLQ